MSVKVNFVGSGDAFGSGGRFNTCILVDGPGIRFTIDFGASSLIALNKQQIPHNSIDAILLTHIHGDHSAGIPFMLLDAMLGAKRDRPLTIAGPKNLEKRLAEAAEVLFPGMEAMAPKFPVNYVELPVGETTDVLGLSVTPYAAKHTWQTDPTALRVGVGDKVVTYSGDGDWTPDLPKAAKDADLFIAECYFYQKPIKWHLNYDAIQEHREEFGAKRMILTHMGPEMLAKADEVPEECAYDGLVVEL
ncbi:MAG: MBL fold metallo-hydrolase [Alphaproteobacteria bacterium]|nr:MBL fold metallo-hydrolase [Alphaproteobacteria bacterium]